MASLTNTKIKDTYDGLLKTTDNDALGGTYKLITDGLGNSSGLYLGTGGNVGIGTSSPQTTLHISKGSNDSPTVMRIENVDTTIETNQEVNTIQFYSNDASTSGTGITSKIAQVAENPGNQYALAFYTYDSSLSEALRISNDGNVGIGTSSPRGILDIDGTRGAYFTTLGSGSYQLIGGNTTSASAAFRIDAVSTGSGAELQFATDGSLAMTIDSSQRVGIGTTSPAALLSLQDGSTEDVSGSKIRMELSGINPYWEIIARNGGTSANRQLGFYTSSIGSDVMTLTQSGNVGIGTSSPSHNLTINSATGGQLQFQTNGIAKVRMEADSGGGSFYAPSGAYIRHFTSGVERLRIDSSGAVLINSTSALDSQVKLQVSANSSGQTSFWANADDIIFEHNENIGLTFSSPNTSAQTIAFADPDSVNSGYIQYVHSDNYLRFATSATERMRIDSSGNVLINNTSTYGDKLVVKSGNYDGTVGAAAIRVYTGTGTGSGTYHGAVAFSAGTGAAAISAVQTGTDSDQIGLSFWTHESATSTDASVERMRITSGGSVLLGTTQERPDDQNDSGFSFSAVGKRFAFSSSDFGVYKSSTTGNKIFFRYGASAGSYTDIGSISFTTTNVAYNTSSDYRLKENVVDMTGALDRVDQLEPKRFNFIADEDTTVDGFLAHEVQDIVPEAVTGEKDAVDDEGNPQYQGIDQSKIVPLLVGAIKELKAEIETLKSQINS